MKCPVCGKYDFPEENTFDICEVCGWENDGVQTANHNYAGGANHLSVNEARIEFFLLNEKSVQEIAVQCKQEFEKECREIRKKYAGTNYIEEPHKAKHQADDFKKAHQKYLSALNDILQSIVNDTIQ